VGAAVDGRTVGCGAVLHLDETTAEIKRMWISPASRGRGIGRRLLARLEDEVRAAGRTSVVLDTNGSLTEAIAMYGAAGYDPADRYNDNPYAQHWFTKTLT
jgi:ribosomal protein S18 acetylase RimI-like enzyme